MIRIYFTDENDNWRDMLHPVKQVKEAERITKNEGLENDCIIYTISPFLVEALCLYALKEDRLNDIQIIFNGEILKLTKLHLIYDDAGRAFDILDKVKLDILEK